MDSISPLLRITALATALFGVSIAFADVNGAKPQALPTQVFKVCGKPLKLELATDDQSRMVGLMYRTGIPLGTGMLFAFARPEIHEFWMHNVRFDIDIGYFDTKGRLVHSVTMAGTSPVVLPANLPRYSSIRPALYAVEAEAGFFSKVKTKNCKIDPLPLVGRD